ncbi:MAG: hypothetical protein M1816_003946 [Peltula sp. TS41687]|nr:MAG: hypothetical protein M1816_003946 [Peltula sp. TS41687]
MASPAEGAFMVDGVTASSPEKPQATSAEHSSTSKPAPPPPRLPSLRASTSDPPAIPTMTVSSTPLGAVNAARRPGPTPSSAASLRAGALPQDMQAKMKAFHQSRQGAPPAQGLRLPIGPIPHSFSSSNVIKSPELTIPGPAVAGVAGVISPIDPAGPLVGGMANLKLKPPGRPQPPSWTSAPVVPGAPAPKPSLGARRGLKLPGGLPGALPTTQGPSAGGSQSNVPKIQLGDSAAAAGTPNGVSAGNTNGITGVDSGSMFNKFSKYVDTKTGTLKFAGKAVIHGKGVDFSSGGSFSISLDEVDTLEELGKGNYGTVYKVRHSRPQMRRPGLGLKGNRRHPSMSTPSQPVPEAKETAASAEGTETAVGETTNGGTAHNTTGVIMAMKEIRLELDEAKFAAIIMELDILHRCISPFIVDFYGAFFQEGAVYICLEYMDGGSVDKLYGDGVPESVLRKITLSTVMGLKTLKEEHNIIHRDVKPTNILVNSRGQVKICDFGVSGNLVASIAKTNIGCQSYMAPERIASGGIAQAGADTSGGTYSVQSDVWSLGLTIIESAVGRYPYAPETYNNIFSQLSAIVDGDPPDLPEEGFSPAARDFVRRCLNKVPKLRPTYAMLLRHPWIAELLNPPKLTDGEGNPESNSTLAGTAEEGAPSTADEEVAKWVIDALERRRSGTMGKKDQPALHAAPLDARREPAE